MYESEIHGRWIFFRKKKEAKRMTFFFGTNNDTKHPKKTSTCTNLYRGTTFLQKDTNWAEFTERK